ncbi:MAG: M48 family metallopeptidase [Odoribacteraceae bacterium]|nr:M48 family metallopeptidase [Odoribacteraceae bacterium]
MKSEFIVPGAGVVKARRGVHIRRLSIRVAAGRGAWVNVPRGESDRAVEEFLLSRREWVEQARARAAECLPGLGFHDEARSREHALRVLPAPVDRPVVRREGREVRLFIPEGEERGRVAAFAEGVLVAIYKEESRAYLPGRVDELARRFGFSRGRLSFRDNLSNWGSCSSRNNISLNVRLMKLPDELIDYVILHELCHTVEKNHSPRFWSLVREVCPGYVGLRERLKRYHTL